MHPQQEFAPPQAEPPEESPRESRLTPLRRRLLELAALVLLLPLLLGLHWYDQRQLVSIHVDPPKRVTKVAPGATGTFKELEWRLADSREAARNKTGEVVRLKITLQVKPLSEAGVQVLTKSRLTYQLRGRDGRIWSAGGVPPTTPVRPGVTVPVAVTATLPADRMNTVELEVLPARGDRPKGSLPLLRFAR